KDDEYDESDVRQLTLLMQEMWGLIQQKRTDDELKNYADELSNANEELKQNSEKLSIANKELRSLDKMKNEFLSNISHELKTPLVSIIGYTELVDGGGMGIVNDKQKKALGVVTRNSKRLKHLIESLLYMTKAQSGTVEYTFEHVNISEIIENTIVDMKLMADNKCLTIEKEVPDDLPLINGDKEKLTNMLNSLVDNAIKFTNPGGKITLTASEEDGNLHITVNDTGIGIAKEFRSNLFKKFYQIDSSTTRRYGGTGLGLYISKHIIEVHNGKIWIESEEDVGTTVHVSIPI
ncbi:MAG: histidine kinase, partial [Methanosarcinaceae archaeon]|nr:histidine kinase [Methanosarcinaceae archaeon]